MDGGVLVGRTQGAGPRVLLLHGGPSLSGDYLEELATELTDAYEVAWYQQRSLSPSVETGPFTVEQHVRDISAVLDALHWPDAWLVGHSWGGHLVIAAAAAAPKHLLGVVSVDPLGCVGDGQAAEFEKAMLDRTPAANRARAQELDERAMRGEGTTDEALESLSLVWPAYFAHPPTAPPMPPTRVSLDGYAQTWASLMEGMPALEASLPGISVRAHFVHGAMSPMPVAASTDAAERIPGASVAVVEGAGHFIWHERPGAIRAELDALTSAP